jgi:dihydrofolate reductase
MPRFVYETAASLDGFLADEQHSLAWLFAVPHDDVAPEEFVKSFGVLVMGSSTYEWLLREEQLLDHPEKWARFYGERPVFVFSSRELPVPEGADLRRRSGTVAACLDEIRAAAGSSDVWLVGGGDLVGQFDDAGALDAVQVTLAPVTLGSGAPLLPRRIEYPRLTLTEVRQQGPFARLIYAVSRPAAS